MTSNPPTPEPINEADNPSVVMYEDWSVRPDGTYYRYRFEGESEWHEKLTGHKGSPFVKFIVLSQTEVNDLVARDVIEPPRTHTKSAHHNNNLPKQEIK